MAEVCLSNGKPLELERLCSRNLTSGTANTHLGRLMWRSWRWSSSKTGLEILLMSVFIRTKDQNVIDVNKTKWKVT